MSLIHPLSPTSRAGLPPTARTLENGQPVEGAIGGLQLTEWSQDFRSGVITVSVNLCIEADDRLIPLHQTIRHQFLPAAYRPHLDGPECTLTAERLLSDFLCTAVVWAEELAQAQGK